MNKKSGFLKTTVIGGVFFLVPIILLFIVVRHALSLINKLLIPFHKLLPVESIGGVLLADILGVVVLLLLCFAAGLLARRARLQSIVKSIETTLLSKLPGYEFIMGVGESFVGFDSDKTHEAVLARFDDGWQFGFAMERLDDGHVVVFIPGSPSPLSGSVFIMEAERIRILDDAQAGTLKGLKAMGIGSNALLGGKAL